MTIPPISGVGGTGVTTPLGPAARTPAFQETQPLQVKGAVTAPLRMPAKAPTALAPLTSMARGLDQIRSAQHRLDAILRQAQSGRSFTPAQLLALQGQVYAASNQIDLAGKVVDRATAGIKQVLQTQV